MMETVLAEAREGLLFLTLNRPEAMNAVNPAMSARMTDLAEAIPELAQDCRVIVLRGGGKAFIAGGDVREFKSRMWPAPSGWSTG